MLRWVSLFLCCIVAGRLAAAMAEVSCDAFKSGVPVAIPRSNGSLTPSTVLLENCRWKNVDVQLKTDGPFVVLLRDVHLVGGSLTIVVSGGLEESTVRSELFLQSSTLSNCSKCLCVSSASAPLFHIDLVLARSIIQATESAATLDAPCIRDSSIRVADSTVEVHSKVNAVVASVITARADNVRIEAVNSNVVATAANGMACGMGITSNSSSGSSTVSADNVALFSANSSVTATGSCSAASMGFAAYNGSVSTTGASIIAANNATLCVFNSSVTATGVYSVASMGFASFSSGGASAITAKSAALFSANSTVTATGAYSVASMGFASFGSGGASTVSADNATLFSVNSSVTISGSCSSASMGFASYSASTITTSDSTISANNATLWAVNSSVTASVASLGFASHNSKGSSTIIANNAKLYAINNSSVTATGSESVAAMGFASIGYNGDTTIIANDTMLFADNSSVTALGYYPAAAMGFAAIGYNGATTISANDTMLFAANSSVTAMGYYPVAAAGFASFGFTDATVIIANNAKLCTANSSVTATGGYSVTAMGFASRSLSSSITANNATLYAANSSVTTTGSGAAAAMGFASYSTGISTITANTATLYAANSRVITTGSDAAASLGFASYSTGISIIKTNTSTLYAINSSVTTTGRESVASMGIASCGTSTNNADNVAFVLCASRLYGSGVVVVAVLGLVPTPAVPYRTRSLLVRSQIVSPDQRCVRLDGHTEGDLPSLAVDLSLQCGSVGTLPRCSFNVTGVSQSLVPVPADSCPSYNFARCDDVFPAPVRPSTVFVLPAWMRDGDLAPSRFVHSFSFTHTATSSTSQSTFSHRHHTVSMLASNNTCTMTTRSAPSPSITPSMAVLGVPPAKSDIAHVAAQLIGSEAAARAVVSSTSVSAAMSSVVSAPSAMTSASRVASLSKVVDCGFGAEIDGEDAVPDTLDLPIHPALGVSRLRYYVGGVALTSSLLVLLPLVAVVGSHATLGETPRSSPMLMWVQRHIFTTFALVCVGFFGPPVVGGGVLLLFFSDPQDWGATVAGGFGVTSVIVAWGLLAAGLWRLPLSIDSSNAVSANAARLAWNFERRMCVTLCCFAESSRDLGGVARFYFSEELLASCAMAAIANAPRVLGSCHGLAWAMAAVALAHVAFVAVVRPYASRLDNVWSLLVASLQVALSVVQTATVYGANGRDLAAALVLAMCASFFLQAALGAMIECVALSRRRVKRVTQGMAVGALEDNGDEGGDNSVLTVPLTNVMNPLADVASPPASTEST